MMRFRRLQLIVETTDGPYGTTLDFPDGLVVIWADNSMGKSTCAKSILVALGLEAMITTVKDDLPLPPAVKEKLESETGEFSVLESNIYLEIENKQRQRIVVHRTIKGLRDKNLITVHEGAALTEPESKYRIKDFFINRSGAATRDVGFHSYLANFLGWTLPSVPSFDGKEYPLYLQCIFPFFLVEQTKGWSTVLPPVPTQLRLREVHKRVIEFLLKLDANRVALLRQELSQRKTSIESQWTAQHSRVKDLSERAGGVVQALPNRPVSSWPPLIPSRLDVPREDIWMPIDERIAANLARLQNLVELETPPLQPIVSAASAELTEKESELQNQQVLLTRLSEAYEMESLELERLQERLAAIDEDIQRNKDVRTLKSLGSRQESELNHGSCPVCHQHVQDALIPLDMNQTVMSLDENIEFLVEQRRTFQGVQINSLKIIEARGFEIRALRDEVDNLRGNIRRLRQTLTSDGRSPSIAAIQKRLTLENSINLDKKLSDQFEILVGKFEEFASSWNLVLEEIALLPKEDLSIADEEKITAWTLSIQDQLVLYGFKSFNVNRVNISFDSYKPEHEGFDMENSFSLETSISASDLIRTIWSYLHGLLEVSRTIETNHPGFIIFDEPRQQSTRDVSFKALLNRAAKLANSDNKSFSSQAKILSVLQII